MDELAALADTIMLSQASVQSVLAEVDADRHNADDLAIRQRPSASAPPPPKEKKKGKPELCWSHQKWGHKAKSCRKPCSWSGNGYWESPRTRRLPLAAGGSHLQLLQSSYGPCSDAHVYRCSGSIPRQEPAPSCRPSASTPAVAHR